MAYFDRVRGYHATESYKKAMRKRGVWVEPLFGEAKQWHGLRQFRLRGLPKVNTEGLLVAAGQNLKRWLVATGWGRRHAPCGALAAPRRAARALTAGLRSIGRPCSVAASAATAEVTPGCPPPGAAFRTRLGDYRHRVIWEPWWVVRVASPEGGPPDLEAVRLGPSPMDDGGGGSGPSGGHSTVARNSAARAGVPLSILPQSGGEAARVRPPRQPMTRSTWTTGP
jgi:hypothetical protein